MRVVQVTPFPTQRGGFGGAERCQAIAHLAGAHTVSVDWTTPLEERGPDPERVTTYYPPQDAHTQAGKLFRTYVGTWDMIPRLTRKHLAPLRDIIAAHNPDVILLEHPWLIDLLPPGVPVVFDAHNDETHNTEQQCGPHSIDLPLVAKIEADTLKRAAHTLYASKSDAIRMRARVTDWTTPASHIPNGTHPQPPTTGKTTRDLLFVGSNYPPNIAAAQHLIHQAEHLPEYRIHIAGNCAHPQQPHPRNVTIHGHVTDQQLTHLYSSAHQFVNPITAGSGTHLKVARALASGVPVVTTPHGKRGYTTPLTYTNPTDLPATIRNVTAQWDTHHYEALREGHEHHWGNYQPQLTRALEQATQ